MNWLLFPETVGRAEQKPGEAVPVVLERRRVSLESDGCVERVGVQRGHAGIEVERAARPFAELRLPVVHQVVDEVEAEPDVVRALHPARIGVEGVGLVVAEERIPASRIAEGRIAGDVQRRHAAFARVRAVRPRNAQHVQSEVGAEIGRLHVLAEPRPAERSVNQESRRDGVGLADARDLHERVARRRAPPAHRHSPPAVAEAEVAMTSASMTLYLNHS